MTSATLPRVSVVGLGKLGAPLAAVLASRGFIVIGLDVSKVLVDSLNAGKMPIVEPVVAGDIPMLPSGRH